MNEIPYQKINTIFLDAGNTLISMDFEWIQNLLDGCGLSCDLESLRRSEAAARPRFSAALPSLKSTEGQDSFTFYMRTLLENLTETKRCEDGAVNRIIREIMPVLKAPGLTPRLWSSVLPGVRDALERLTEKNYRLIVVSNSDGTVEESLVKAGLRSYFDAVVDSHWAGFEKPDPRLFQYALGIAGATPEETVHIGDMYEVDITGARSAGIHAVLLDPFNDWEHVDCIRFPDLLGWTEIMLNRPV